MGALVHLFQLHYFELEFCIEATKSETIAIRAHSPKNADIFLPSVSRFRARLV